MSAERYDQYLPDAVRELQEFQRLGQIEGMILEEEAAAKETLVNNQWILTAERSGLLRLAKIMGLLGAEKMETEVLRTEILFRWNSRRPYTYFHLLDWLDECCGAEEYAAELKREEYLLRLILELSTKDKKAFLEKQLRKIVPANMVLQVDLNTNTHGRLRVMTHGQMNALGWTHGQIPFEDLKPYEK